jgi:small GTP-binding protein
MDYWNRFEDQLDWQQGDDWTSPLHEAIINGHTNVVRFLLSKGAAVDRMTKSGKTALYIAAEDCNTDCEMLLIHCGASLVYTSSWDRSTSCFDTPDKHFLQLISGQECDNIPTSVKSHLVYRALVSSARLGIMEELEKYVLMSSEGQILQAIQKAEMVKSHTSVAFLKLALATIKGDVEYVRNVYQSKGNVPKAIRLATATISSTVLLRLASSHSSNPLIYQELLIHTGIFNHRSLEVSWDNIGLHDHFLYDPNIFKSIANVGVLNLSHNNLTRTDKMFKHLFNLTVLDLSANKLKHIDRVIFNLPHLKSLNLSNNLIQHLPVFNETQDSLVRLDLSSNLFQTFPQCVSSFINLRYLNLSHNEKISSLPSWLIWMSSIDDLRLEGLSQLDTSYKNASHSTEATIKLLKYQYENSRPVYEMKMIITGAHGSGKTSLVNRLDGVTHILSSSPLINGISIYYWSYRLSAKSKEYQYNIWDMSGVDDDTLPLGLSIDEMFYTPHCIYLMVFDVTKFDRQRQQLEERVQIISSLDESSCVLFIGTHWDLVPNQAKETTLDRVKSSLIQIVSNHSNNVIFSNVVFLPVSLMDSSFDMGIVHEAIFNVSSLLEQPDGQPYMGRSVLLSAVGLKGEVEEYTRMIRKGNLSEILKLNDIESMISNLKDAEVRTHDELHTITHFLNDMGSLLYYGNRQLASSDKRSLKHMHCLKDTFFMDPDWLLGKIRGFVHQRSSQNYGPFHQETIKKILFSGDDDERQDLLFPHLISLMVCFNILHSLDDEGLWYVTSPRLFPSRLGDDIKSIIDTTDFCYFQRYSLQGSAGWDEFMIGVLSMVVRHATSEDGEFVNGDCFNCWMDGIIWIKGISQGLYVQRLPDYLMRISFLMEKVPFLDELVELIETLFPEVKVSFECRTCRGDNRESTFSIHDCMKVLSLGGKSLSCRHGDHQIDISDVIPAFFFQPTHSLDALNSELSSVRFFSTTSSYIHRFNAKYRGRKILLLKYHINSESSLRKAFAKSLSLSNYSSPSITNEDGRLLAISAGTNEVLLVCEIPPLGTLSCDSQLENPTINHPLVLYHVAIQLAKSLTCIPRYDNSMCIQFWSLDVDSLIHCTIALSSKSLNALAADVSSSNDDHITRWVDYMKQLCSPDVPAYYLSQMLDKSMLSISLEYLIEHFTSISVQLTCDIHSLTSIRPPISSSQYTSLEEEIWLASLHNDKDEVRIGVYSPTKSTIKTFKVASNAIEVQTISICSDHVWMSSRLPGDVGCLTIFKSSSKKLVHSIKMKNNSITCIEHVYDEVCAGTMAGYLFIFSDDVIDIKEHHLKPRHKYIADGPITGLIAITNQVVCFAHSHSIFSFDIKEMTFVSSFSTLTGNDAIGHLYLSWDKAMLYGVNYGSVYIKAWDVASAKQTYNLNIQEVADGVSNELCDSVITAFTISSLDGMVWVGVDAGFILMYHMKELVCWLRPFGGIVSSLSHHVTSSGGCTIISTGVAGGEEGSHKLVSFACYSKEVLAQLMILQDDKGNYLNSFESVSALIDGGYGFTDKGMIVKDSTNEETRDQSAHRDDDISVQIFDNGIVKVPVSYAITFESLMRFVLAHAETTCPSSYKLVYSFQGYATMVEVSSDDELHCYLELTHKPLLLLTED